ncbi:MAG: DnaJ domain-containing protein [Promethearchaeota archaeon]
MEKYYRILGLPKTTNSSEIKTAFKKLAFKYHPDRAKISGLDLKEAETKFRNVREAYTALSEIKSEKQRFPTHSDNKNPTRDFNDDVFLKTIQELVSTFNTRDFFEVPHVNILADLQLNDSSHIDLTKPNEFHIDLRKSKKVRR